MKTARIIPSLVSSLTACSLTACALGSGSGTPSEAPTSRGTPATPTTLADAPFLTDLVVDSATVYWTDNAGNVWSTPTAGGTPVSLATTNVADDFPSLADDGTNLYVANATAIASVPEQGGTLAALATAPGPASSIALRDGVLYWASSFTNPAVASSAVIDAMPVGGGAITALASNLSAPGSVVVDDGNVFFADIGTGTIDAVPVGGGSVTVLASNQMGIGGLAVSDGVVYWSNYNGPAAGVVGQAPPEPSLGDGTINAVASDGGDSWVIARGYATTAGIAVSGSYVYWTDGFKNTISRTAIDGAGDSSDTEVIAHDSYEVGPVASGGSLYYGVALPPPQNVFQLRSVAK